MNNSIIEINKKKAKAGRTPVKLVLHKLHKDESEYNKNGITWIREYCENNIDSIKGMQLVTQFLDDKHEVPFGDHGNMQVIEENKVIFEDSLVVGSFTKGYVAENLEINGEIMDAVVGEGYLYNQRFPKLVEYLQEEYNNGHPIEGSVEICADESKGNTKIIYKDGWKEKGRIPTDFQYSGHALVIGTNPADDNALLLELNSYRKKEGGNLKGNVIELNKISYDDIATLITRAINKAMGESSYYGDYYIYKFYPVDSQIVFRKWQDVGIYYSTTYKIENSTITIGDIIKVEEDWKPVSNSEPVEINAKKIREIIKGGNTNMEELIREKDKKIEELTNQLSEVNAKNSELTSKVEELDGKVNELNSTLVEVNKTLEDTKKEKEGLTTEVNSLKEYKENKESEIKKAEVNTYFETEIPKNGFEEAEINTLKEYVEKCDLEGLKKAEADLIVKKFKEIKKDISTETNSKKDNLFFNTKEEKIDDVEAGKALFN
jgi:hypothetical protein